MDNIEEAQEWTKLLVERALKNEHILKELEHKKDKYWNKIINHIYLLLLDNSIQENNLTTCPSSRKIILNNLNSFINH